MANETVERVGVCKSKAFGFPALFQRIKIKLSRMYRAWPVPGDNRSVLLHPSEYMGKYETLEYQIPE